MYFKSMKGDLVLKKYTRMRKRFSLCCVALLFVALIGLPLSVNAESVVLTHDISHKHVAGCMVTLYKTMSADGYEWLRTVSTDTCSCGGFHDYYEYDASCSCGRTWHATGHACVNSIYGTNHGSCTNYSYIDCGTQHSHPYTDYGCGKTENDVVSTIMVRSSTISPAQNVTLKASSSGELKDVRLSWEGTSDSDTLTVKKNGNYKLYASYTEAGVEYVTEIKVPVTNIDNTSPVISEITVSEEEFTANNIILQVTAKDGNGLPADYVNWNGSGYGRDNQFEVTENGTYQVVIRDLAGNTAEKQITINNIDKGTPEILSVTAEPTPWYEDVCTITIEAEDAEGESGLDELPYSWDEGLTWTDENFCEITEPGIVIVQVRDRAGNIAQDSIEVIKEEPPAEETSESSEEITTEPSENASEEITSETMENKSEEVSSEYTENMSEEAETDLKEPILEEAVPENTGSGSNTVVQAVPNVEPNKQEVQMPAEGNNVVSKAKSNPEEVASPVEEILQADEKNKEKETINVNKEGEEDEGIQKPHAQKETVVVEEPIITEGNGVTKMDALQKEEHQESFIVILSVVSGVLALILLPIMLFMFFGRCCIYEKGETKKENFLGKAAIHCKKKGYKININQRLVDKAGSRILVVRLPKWFAKKEAFKPITISAGKTLTDTYVEKEIEIRIKE